MASFEVNHESPPDTFIPATYWTYQPTPDISWYSAKLEAGVPHAVADDLVMLRLPLPFALNHINVYLIKEDNGWAIIDCGVNTSKTRAIWEDVLETFTPVTRVIVTHHHPDHIGLAGWLAQKCHAPLFITHGEHEVADRYADPNRDIISERFPLWNEHGLGLEHVKRMLEFMPNYNKVVTSLAGCEIHFIDPAARFVIGKRIFQPLMGQGHSPDHLSLWDREGLVMIGGDQVLPDITPNIAVWPGGDQNPLRSYFQTLKQFLSIGHDTLLLPSHNQPLYGLATRVHQIYQHHDERLAVLWRACDGKKNAYELAPALFGRQLRDAEMGFGMGEIIAHLNYLEGEGYLQSQRNESGTRVFSRR